MQLTSSSSSTAAAAAQHTQYLLEQQHSTHSTAQYLLKQQHGPRLVPPRVLAPRRLLRSPVPCAKDPSHERVHEHSITEVKKHLDTCYSMTQVKKHLDTCYTLPSHVLPSHVLPSHVLHSSESRAGTWVH